MSPFDILGRGPLGARPSWPYIHGRDSRAANRAETLPKDEWLGSVLGPAIGRDSMFMLGYWPTKIHSKGSYLIFDSGWVTSGSRKGLHSSSLPRKGSTIRIHRQIEGHRVLARWFLIAGSLLLPFLTVQAQEPRQIVGAAGTANKPAPTDFWSNRGRWAFGTQLGIAVENNIPRDISHITLMIAQPSVGFTLKEFYSRAFPVSSFSVVGEGVLGGAIHPGGELIGHALLFRLDGRPMNRVVPFFDFGAGVLHTSLAKRAPELTGATQFNPQGGMGIQYFFDPQKAFVLEYRYMHVSNNGIQEPNHGFNSSMITIGFRWLRRSRPPSRQPGYQRHSVRKFLLGKD